ncbi:MAG: GHMP family kinase ATP-binding protein [Terriglobales bacterium]
MLIARSPVRISFAGGGTDLPGYFERYGGAVLSTTINKYFYTILQKRSDDRIQVISSDLRVTETWEDIGRITVKGSSLEIPLSTLKEIGFNAAVDMFLASEIPPGTGLGSSASVCVGVLKALTTYCHQTLSKHQLAELSFKIARQTLLKPVGKQDEYASAFGGLNYISFHRDGTTAVEPLNLPPVLLAEFQSSLMLFFTGSSHHSWTILEEQERTVKSSDENALESLHEIRALADEQRNALVMGDLSAFGELMHRGWQAKKRISEKISNSHIDELYRVARDNGALGGKITGAGGGGFLLLFCHPDAKKKIREVFRELNIREMNFEFDSLGAHVVVDDPFIGSDTNGGVRWTFTPVLQNSPGSHRA